MPREIQKTEPEARPQSVRPRTAGSLRKVGFYALLAGCAFAAALLLVYLVMRKADWLASHGLLGSAYYLVLIPFGLCAAAFLFGALRSFASYSGKHLGGILELGGPVVGFTLVLILGFQLGPPAANGTFDLTVFVYGEAGPSDLVLRNLGRVYLRLGNNIRNEPIGHDGQAEFKQVPTAFRSASVDAWVNAPGYDNKLRPISIDGNVAKLVLNYQDVVLEGRVVDSNNKPVAGAKIEVGEIRGTTDMAGNYRLVIPGPSPTSFQRMLVEAEGFLAYRAEYQLGESMVRADIVLKSQL